VAAIAKVSTAAKSLCMWIHAMAIYDRVAKTVEPKKKLLAKMNAELDAANASLNEKQAELKEILDKVAGLKATLEATLAEKKQLEDDTALTQGRLQRAEKLTVGLADEHVRWQETVSTLDEKILNLIGDVFISAACISYYGPFTGTYRTEMVKEWVVGCVELKIPTTDGCNLRGVLEDPVMTREWQLDGLPSDEVSTNNAIMVTRGKRWPLLIDPQEQGKKWITKMEMKNKLCTSRLTNKNMLRDLENCIRIGPVFKCEIVVD
jgi:dynein heavy chain